MKESTPKRSVACRDLEVRRIEFYADDLYLIELAPLSSDPAPLPSCAPGQFVEVLVPQSVDTFLRRPISIYYSDAQSLGMLVRVAGKGTRQLSQCRVGEVVNVLFPLGNRFTPPAGKAPLLVGGGVGIAPLLKLGEEMASQGIRPTFLLGGKGQLSFPDLSRYEGCGRLLLTTEDGSMGEKGFVTQHSILTQEHFSEVYVCGSTPMMKAMAAWAKEQELPCEVSLENMMACGMGVCLCCVEPTTTGHRCVCTDGPVFNTHSLLW